MSGFEIAELDGKFFVANLHPDYVTREYDTHAEAEEEITTLRSINIRPGESSQEREDRLIGYAKEHPLVNKPCDCGEDTGFRCYPENGQCPCGCWKHHVHNNCGHIVQWG